LLPNSNKFWTNHKRLVAAPHKVYCYLLHIIVKNLHSWCTTYIFTFWIFLEFVLITISKLFYTKIFNFNMSLGLWCFDTVLILNSWHVFVMFLDVKGEICCWLMMTQVGAKTSCHLINILKRCVSCNWRLFKALWLICQQGQSIYLWFMCYCAPPHFLLAVQEFLNMFLEWWIWWDGTAWHAHSWFLDFNIWIHPKFIVYAKVVIAEWIWDLFNTWNFAVSHTVIVQMCSDLHWSSLSLIFRPSVGHHASEGVCLYKYFSCTVV